MIPRRRSVKQAQPLAFSHSQPLRASSKRLTWIVHDTGFLYSRGKGV
jgi:hypothetical protein